MRNTVLAVVAAALLASLCGFQSTAPQAIKVGFSESWRKESRTITEDFGSSSSTQSEEASGGKMTLNIELPLGGVDPKNLDPSTTITIKAGDFSFNGTLKDDPHYQTGNTSAKIVQSQADAQTGKTSPIATALLRWDKNHLTVKIDASLFLTKPIAAASLQGRGEGEVVSTAKSSIDFAGVHGEADVFVRGKLHRQKVELPGVSGEILTMDLKGEAK